ncbi:MAG: phytoene desaturase [Pseudomonadota bacterium]
MTPEDASPVIGTAGGLDKRPPALVIGSGFGGLAAAVRLGARGYRVTVLEKLDQAGGRASVFRQDGFTFDGGPTIITAPYLLEELWALAGKRFADDIDLRAIDPFYKIRFDDGRVFTYSSDDAAMRAEIARFSPEDAENYDRFMARSAEIYKVAFEDLAAVPFHSLRFTFSTFSDLLRLGGHKTVFHTVGQYFKDPQIRTVFSFHPLLIGGNPLTTTAYYCLIGHLERLHGVHFAIGGTGAIVQGLVDLIEGQGGEVRTDSEVAEILESGDVVKGVKLTSGEKLVADVVVSNADSAWTYSKMLPKTRKRRWRPRKLKRKSFSMGLFVWYFGTKRQYPDVYHHTMVLGPRYEGLLTDIFKRMRLTQDFSLYLHRPSASDPGLAPEGCDSFYALVPVPNLDSGTDWSKLREPFRESLQARLEETLLPDLGDQIVTSHILTPQDFLERYNSVLGAGFSLEPKLLQSAWFRPHNRSEEIKGLYLVGAGTHPGAGVPGVISSAKILDEIVPDPVMAR